MKWENFLKTYGNLPLIDTEFLLAGVSSPEPVKVQISRWKKAGKIIQLKRGVYILSEPYRKQEAFELSIASFLKKPSYVSLEKALEYHGLIPEAVPVYTSVTTKRTWRFVSEIGAFIYRHIKETLFWGYNSVVSNNQTAFIASPEKALLDYVYFKSKQLSKNELVEMRLQNVEIINTDKLLEYARRFSNPAMTQSAELIMKHVIQRRKEEKTL